VRAQIKEVNLPENIPCLYYAINIIFRSGKVKLLEESSSSTEFFL